MTRGQILVLFFFSLLFLGGCSSVSRSSHTSLRETVEVSANLIQAQQELLSIQSDQLEQMSANQHVMATALENVQSQLVSLQLAQEASSNNIEKEPKPRSTSSKKKTESVSGRKVSAQAVTPVEGKMIVGRNEWVWLDLLDQVFNARIDTGTRTSTINAKEIQPFERNGESWVRFQLASDDSGQTWEAPLARYVRIRNSSEEPDRRPVVKLTVRLGSFVEDAEFTLANRAIMPYPVQLGRDFLRDIALVDVSKRFTQPKPDTQTVAR